MANHRRQFVLAAVACGVSCAAGVGVAFDVRTAAVAPEDETFPPGVLVLKGGRVVTGEIARVGGGFEVAGGAGKIIIPAAEVAVAGRDLIDAYGRLRVYVPRTADGHVGLARWCMANQLLDEAQKELGTALAFEPHHAEARATAGLLDEIRHPGRTNTTVSETPTPVGATATLGDLPPELAREFVSTIQPILVNRCGNAGCHAARAERPFTVQYVSAASSGFRSSTQANFDAVRAQLRAGDPAASPLLGVPSRPDHAGGRNVFAGPTGERLRETLTNWVRQSSPLLAQGGQEKTVASASALNLPGALAAPATPKPFDTRRDATVMPASAVAPVPTSVTESSVEPLDSDLQGLGRPLPPDSETAAVLKQVLADDRPDAFDPARFNRLYGPAPPAASPLSGNSPPAPGSRR